MVIIVVLINIIISIMLLYIAWLISQLKDKLITIAERLNSYEHAIHTLLYTASENIYTGQQQIYELRQKNQKLKLQIQQVQQLLNLLLVVRKLLHRYSKS
jgi:plasmid rolling circle replication initiator protein Rep